MVESFDQKVSRRVSRLISCALSGDIDAAVTAAIALGDMLERAVRRRTITYDEFVEWIMSVRRQVFRGLGAATAGLIFLGEMDARTARDGTTYPGRDEFAAQVGRHLASC